MAGGIGNGQTREESRMEMTHIGARGSLVAQPLLLSRRCWRFETAIV